MTFWQTSTLGALTLVIGPPVGVAAGWWAWALFAEVLAISPGIVIPVGTVLLLIPAVLVAANVLALWPARSLPHGPGCRAAPGRVADARDKDVDA